MCGIAGLFNFVADGSSSERDAGIVRAMISTMAHRGPDADGVWSDARKRCVFGHRRLSIIDTSDAGRQPRSSNSGRWVITFNGEIYNFADVRDALAAEGIAVRGRTDTEVLIESIALWGLEALPKLDGMFAFGAFNTESGELLLARDPFGEKPLYYMELPGGGLAFASELQALQQVPGFDDEVSVDAMAEVLMFQYIGAPRTVYKSVRKLPPGHWLSARAGQQVRVGRYFEFSPCTSGFDHRPIADLADELEDILARSIKRRLISDVPLGAFLSGGVDSSTVCALVRKKLSLPLKTFSIGFENAPESEHDAARAFARHLGTEHHDQILTPHTSDFLLSIGRLLDEPNADSSCMPTYLLSEFARRQVTVALSGDGGDEMFAGYGRYFTTLDEHASGRGDPGHDYYSGRILVSTEKHIEELFGSVPHGLAAHLSRLRTEINEPSPPLFCRLRKSDVDNYLPGAVLPKVDRMSMQHSLEVRTPFLNVELARFAERLPLNVLYGSGRGKLLLREIAYRYLPRHLIDTPKKGFGIPMSRWGREPLLNVASKLLETDDSRLRQALGSDAIDRFMKRQRGLGGFSTYQVWSISMLESWLRHHPATVPQVFSIHDARKQQPTRAKPLYAWPVSERVFAVVSDETMRLDGSFSGARAEDAERREGLSNLLHMALLTTGQGDKPTLPPPMSRLQPLTLPGWREKLGFLPRRDLRPLRGATLAFPERTSATEIDFGEMRKYEALGVAELLMMHPYRYDRTLVRLRLQKKSWPRRLKDALKLHAQRVDRIGVKRGTSANGVRYGSVPVPNTVNEVDTELSGRYMLFQGAYQLPPLAASHDDIRTKGGGRYSVWSQSCLFSAAASHSLLAFPYYWLVEKTELTEAYLDVLPELIPPPRCAQENWETRLALRLGQEPVDVRPPVKLAKRDRVVVLTHGLPPGGAERQWCYLAQGLKEAGYDVTFAVIENLNGPNAHYLPWLEERGIAVRQIASLQVDEVLRHLPRDAASRTLLFPNPNPFHLSLDLLTAFLRAVRPKVVFAQLDSVNVLAGIATHLAEVPCAVMSFRNYNPTHFSYLDNDWFLPTYRALAKSPRILWSGNSNAGNLDYAEWIGMEPDRIAFIPNAIDPQTHGKPTEEAVHRLRAELGIADGVPVILGVFRFSEEKRPLDFVEVCARVAGTVPGLRALMVGIGPLAKEIQTVITGKGLEHVIKLLGRREDVPALMSISSVLLLTSSHEGTPNVVMEAQLLGLPVVATNCGGTPDLVEHGVTGLLGEVADIGELTRHTVEILSDTRAAVAMREVARRRILEKFSVELLARRHLELVDRQQVTTASAAVEEASKSDASGMRQASRTTL